MPNEAAPLRSRPVVLILPCKRANERFLARVRSLLTARAHVVVLVDSPSDRRDLGGDFRDSADHATDLGAVIAHARQTFGKKVWLVGHSRGTHSAVTAATRLAGAAAPDGIAQWK